MQKKYSNQFKKYVPYFMNQYLPDFQIWQGDTIYLWPGEKAFYKKASESLYLFIIFVPDKKGDNSFTIEVGWSKKSRFPELEMRPCPFPDFSEAHEEEEFATRLTSIEGKPDLWRKFSPTVDAGEAVIIAVENAVKKTVDIGVPYLEEVSKRYIN